MLLGARQFFEQEQAAPLPYDAEVEWIQTGNGAWVDTGIKPVSTIVVQIRCLATRDIGDTIFGFNLGNDAKDWRLFNSTQQIYFDWGTGRISGGANTLKNNTWYEFELGNFYVKDIPTDTILLSGSSRDGDVLSDATLTFGRGNNTTASAKFGWCKITIGGVIVRDFIPVRFTNELGQSEGAMYDRVSGALFRNAGTGAFTIGPDKTSWTNPYVTDGLVAMWDGEWNAGGGVHDPNATVWKDVIGNRDWTLGASTSYEWTANSFDAKDQFAATQDFIYGSLVKTVEVCARVKSQTPTLVGNFAFIIIGRLTAYGSYYGLLYRNKYGYDLALMGGLSYWIGTYTEFAGIKASFSFPNLGTMDADGYFNSMARAASGNNTLDYNATTRGTVARIGGTAQQPMPIEVYSIRLYSRVIAAAEIAHNHAVDKERFNLP